MYLPMLSNLALLLTLASAQSTTITVSPNEASCKTKTTNTGSGAHASIKGFCGRDTLAADSELAHNGYTAGGFKPSGLTSTTFIAAKGCKSDADKGVRVEDCLERFFEVCATGDGNGHGIAEFGCQEYSIV